MGYEKFLRIVFDIFPGNNHKKFSSTGQTSATVQCLSQEFLNGESFPRYSRENLQSPRIPWKELLPGISEKKTALGKDV